MSNHELTPPPNNRSVAIENIEPTDNLAILMPRLMAEHLARYNYAAEVAQDYFETDAMLTVLNLASARGYGNNILEEQLPASQIIGLEYGSGYIQKAHESYPETTFVQADVRRTPIAADSTDMVVAFEITEHLPQKDQANFLNEMYRFLKPQGIAIVSVPEPYSAGIGKNSHHLHEPSVQEMQEYIADAGFETLETLGQIGVSPKVAQWMKQINKLIPLWPLYVWGPKRDTSVRPVPDDELALTHVFVLRKP